jgi:hypothetical protein
MTFYAALSDLLESIQDLRAGLFEAPQAEFRLCLLQGTQHDQGRSPATAQADSSIHPDALDLSAVDHALRKRRSIRVLQLPRIRQRAQDLTSPQM